MVFGYQAICVTKRKVQMTIKGAITLSVFIHSLMAFPFHGPPAAERIPKEERPIVVDYVRIQAPEKM